MPDGVHTGPGIGTSPAPSLPRFCAEVACAVLLALLFLLLLATAAFRHVGYTAPGVYELIRIIFVYLIGLAAIVAFARRVNLHVPAWWRSDSLSYQTALLVLSLTLTFLTVRMLVMQGFGTDASSLLRLPEGISHIPVGLFGAGLSLQSGARLYQIIRQRQRQA